MGGADIVSAFSVGQCVTKRSRQLERLLYMVESTATKFQQAKALSSTLRAQVQKRYGRLLLDFLEKQRSLGIPDLLTDAMHLESYDEELQQLLVLVEDEELLRQRVGATWEFLAATSINQDIVALVRACEGVWNELVPLTSSAIPLINSIRGEVV
ncbi:hypothetical protein PF005_g8016 [Phytophthora fragariae]|uniref:Uncharacterized protein n=2 Tax=Phytophthora TaxID=4783 RepID=A0A6A4E6E0_9STRA|nr:hypothetical protein PF003_g22592 [Phytophthora fragariae]KAE8982283.1 hypothetical protein PR002_g23569 [Phytophthora rubi]KAE8941542.1 hypothetical protein PF009_g8672 [Phytophthora fragariae]KAE8985509.1 hypothetical protein PR001_g22868 [Phytophthora rubi]KAE9015386.1 hypothetical protein PF011_g7646 [Phytophthora fragariae]